MAVRRQDYVGTTADAGIVRREAWVPFFNLLKLTASAETAFVALFTETGYLMVSSGSAELVRISEDMGFDDVIENDGITELDVTPFVQSLVMNGTDGVLLGCPIKDQYGCVYGLLGMYQPPGTAREPGSQVLKLVSYVVSAVCRAFLPEQFSDSFDDVQRLALISMAEDLDAAQTELKSLLDNVPAAVVVTDEVGGVIRGNRLAEAMFGTNERPLTLCNIKELIVESAERLPENKPHRTLARNASAELFPVAVAFSRRDVQENVKEITYTITDLSTMTEIEAQANHARAELERFIELVRVPIMMLDLAGNITGCNSNAAALLGVTAEEAMGQKFHMRFMDEVDAQEQQAAFDRFDQGEDLHNLQLKVRAADGSYLYLLVSITVRRDSEGNPLGRIAFGQDITEIRKNESILHQSQKMETLGQLTGGIAHDFNNLLNIIGGNLRFLESVFPAESEEREVVEDAVSAADDAGDLINRLLTFSRNDFGSIARMNIAQAIYKVTRVTQRVIKGSVTLEVLDLAPELEVDVDAIWFESSLLNLITNARDSMGDEGGRITIGAECVELQRVRGLNLPPGRYARVWVQDTGPGVPESLRSRIFDPFFTTKASGKGTGLGLSMVYLFCQRSGGYCEIDEAYTKGARFVLTLPLARAAEQSSEESEESETPEPRSINARPLVLLVEDDERVRRVVLRDFKKMGFDCLQAGSADEALLILQEDQPFSLVFSDVIMPGARDGFDLADWILENRPNLPVLLTSAYVGKEGVRNDAVELIAKPYDVSELERRVMILLR